MKAGLSLTAAILLGGALLGWRGSVRLGALQESSARLEQEARAAGIDPEHPETGFRATASRPAPITEEEREAAAKAAVARLAGIFGEIQIQMSRGEQQLSPELSTRLNDLKREILGMDDPDLRLFLKQLESLPGVDPELRTRMQFSQQSALAAGHPALILALTAEAEGTGFKWVNPQAPGLALLALAQSDPAAALDWIRTHPDSRAMLMNEGNRFLVISAIGLADPGGAFAFLAEIGARIDEQAARSLVDSATTRASRTALLDSLPDYFSSHPEEGPQKQAITLALARTTLTGKFEDGIKPLAMLTDEERRDLAGSVTGRMIPIETARWLDWIGTQVPPEALPGKTAEIIGSWMEQDWRAASAWLRDQPAGAARDAGIEAYAGRAADREPESAAELALTLPSGKKSDEILNSIREEWRKQDAAAEEEFARNHGISN